MRRRLNLLSPLMVASLFHFSAVFAGTVDFAVEPVPAEPPVAEAPPNPAPLPDMPLPRADDVPAPEPQLPRTEGPVTPTPLPSIEPSPIFEDVKFIASKPPRAPEAAPVEIYKSVYDQSSSTAWVIGETTETGTPLVTDPQMLSTVPDSSFTFTEKGRIVGINRKTRMIRLKLRTGYEKSFFVHPYTLTGLRKGQMVSVTHKLGSKKAESVRRGF